MLILHYSTSEHPSRSLGSNSAVSIAAVRHSRARRPADEHRMDAPGLQGCKRPWFSNAMPAIVADFGRRAYVPEDQPSHQDCARAREIINNRPHRVVGSTFMGSAAEVIGPSAPVPADRGQFLCRNASVCIVTAPMAVAEREIATGGSMLAVNWLSGHCTGEPIRILSALGQIRPLRPRRRHSRRQTSRDFVPWRFLDAGRLSARDVSSRRRPKTSTIKKPAQ
jgi:hypothetical protein